MNQSNAVVFDQIKHSNANVRNLRAGQPLFVVSQNATQTKHRSLLQELRSAVLKVEFKLKHPRRGAIQPFSPAIVYAEKVASSSRGAHSVELSAQACIRGNQTSKNLSDNLDKLEHNNRELYPFVRLLDLESDESNSNFETTIESSVMSSNTQEESLEQMHKESSETKNFEEGSPLSYGSVVSLRASHGGWLSTEVGRNCHAQISALPTNLESRFTIWSANYEFGAHPKEAEAVRYGDVVFLQCHHQPATQNYSDNSSNEPSNIANRRILASSGFVGQDKSELIATGMEIYKKSVARNEAKAALALGESGGTSRQQYNRLLKHLSEHEENFRYVNIDIRNRNKIGSKFRVVTLPIDAKKKKIDAGNNSSPRRDHVDMNHKTFVRGRWILKHAFDPEKNIGKEVCHGESLMLEQGWFVLSSDSHSDVSLFHQQSSSLVVQKIKSPLSTETTTSQMANLHWSINLVQLPKSAPLEISKQEENTLYRQMMLKTAQICTNYEESVQAFTQEKMAEVFPSAHPNPKRQSNIEEYMEDLYQDRVNRVGFSVNSGLPLSTDQALAGVYGVNSSFAKAEQKKQLKAKALKLREEEELCKLRDGLSKSMKARLMAGVQVNTFLEAQRIKKKKNEHKKKQNIINQPINLEQRLAQACGQAGGLAALFKLNWAANVIIKASRMFLKSRWQKQLRRIDISLRADIKGGLDKTWTYPVPSEVGQTHNDDDDHIAEEGTELSKNKNTFISPKEEQRVSSPTKSTTTWSHINHSHSLPNVIEISSETSSILHSFSATINVDRSIPVIPKTRHNEVSDRERVKILNDEFPELLSEFHLIRKSNQKKNKTKCKQQTSNNNKFNDSNHHVKPPQKEFQARQRKKKILRGRDLKYMQTSSNIKVVNYSWPHQILDHQKKIQNVRISEVDSEVDSDDDSDVDNVCKESHKVVDDLANKFHPTDTTKTVQEVPTQPQQQPQQKRQFENIIGNKPCFGTNRKIGKEWSGPWEWVNSSGRMSQWRGVEKDLVAIERNSSKAKQWRKLFQGDKNAFDELFVANNKSSSPTNPHDNDDNADDLNLLLEDDLILNRQKKEQELIRDAFDSLEEDLESESSTRTTIHEDPPVPKRSIHIVIKPNGDRRKNHDLLPSEALASINNSMRSRPLSAPPGSARNFEVKTVTKVSNSRTNKAANIQPHLKNESSDNDILTPAEKKKEAETRYLEEVTKYAEAAATTARVLLSPTSNKVTTVLDKGPLFKKKLKSKKGEFIKNKNVAEEKIKRGSSATSWIQKVSSNEQKKNEKPIPPSKSRAKVNKAERDRKTSKPQKPKSNFLRKSAKIGIGEL